MNKFKKLLSVLLAVIMAFSCFSVIGSAYQDYEDPDAYFYDSNDNPRSYLYTDEQRFSFLADTINDLLEGLGLNINETVLGFINIKLDLRSIDALFDSFDGVSGYLNYLGFVLGDLGDLDFDLLTDASVSIYNDNGAQDAIGRILDFVGANADKLGDIVAAGNIDLGLIGNFVDISAVGDILGDLPGLIGGLIYGLGTRKLTNGIGSDPKYPNSTLWDDLENNAKPNFDTMVENLIFKLLTEPNHTVATSDPTRNLIITSPETFGATAEMIHKEEDTGLYYIYGTQKADGTWTFTEATTTSDDSDKNYISQWDDTSALLNGKAGEEFKEILDLTNGDVYTLLENAIPWAYNTFGGTNLDGQLRATLMQFCGAYNNGNVDDATKEQLKAKMDAYKQIEKDANGDKQALRDAFASEIGAAGNVNFMYIDLEGKNVGDKTSDSLYYVVEWEGSYQYYHVERGDVSPFYELIDWEYQAPMWETIIDATSWTAGTSILKHINDIVGTILKSAVPTLEWTAGTAANTLAGNVTELVKLVITTDTVKLFGSEFELPADFNNYNLEQCLVMIAGQILDDLMPQLIVPEDASSVEEVGAYALREFMAEILPHLGAGWDAKFEAAKALTGTAREDAFLDIVLNMGVSTGAYYLQNLIGLGTKTNGSNTTTVEEVPMGASYEWREILDYIVDWVVATFVPRLTSKIDQTVMNGNDPLLKLSAVLSTLMPSLVKILGADVDGYAINLNHVYEDLRKVFNGDFSAIAEGLFRKASGTSANMTVMGALATLLTELFGGLGLNTHSRWTELKGVMDKAAASSTPLTTLIGTYGNNENLANLIRPFLSALVGTRSIWLNDVVSILLHIIGGLNKTLTNNGVVVDGVESAYTGSDKFEIDYKFSMSTIGVKTYFNNGRYKTTAGALANQKTGFDGEYSMKIIDAKVVDANGNVKGGTTTINQTVGANEEYPIKHTFEGVTDKIEIYTLETRYQIIAPDGSVGDIVTDKQSFTVTKLVNDALSARHISTPENYNNNGKWVSTISGCGDSAILHKFDGNWTINIKNIYISEVEALSKAATQAIFSMTDKSHEYRSDNGTDYTPGHSWTKVWVADYGTNTYNDDGSISITDGSGASKITVAGSATSLNDTWFKWNGNHNALNTESFLVATPTKGYYDVTSLEHPLWVTATNVNRSDFTNNYYQYKMTIPLSLGTTMGSNDGTVLSGDSMNVTDFVSFDTYITLYNSYDLQSKLDAALAVEDEDYDTTAAEWIEFQNAIDYANLQMYGAWEAAKFEANHTTNVAGLLESVTSTYEGYEGTTVSTFKYAGDRLEVAMNALADCKLEEDADSSADKVITPSNPSSDLYPVYEALKAVDEKGYKNQNYVLYRWFKFSDNREAIRTALNAATPPAEAPNTLVGVPLDNEGINGVVNAISDADIKAVVEALVEAPTQEAIDAAAEALANYEMPEYDVTVLLSNVQDMQTAEKRLISKYDAQQKYFLNKSIEDYGNVADDGTYSEGSYANYAAALAAAKAANNSTTASQFEIFLARYEFQIAYNKLVLASEEVDMSVLKETYLTAQDILDKMNTVDAYPMVNEEITVDEAYEQLLLATGYPVEYDEAEYIIGGEYTAEFALANEGMYTAVKKQNWVNEVNANLEAAIANFESAKEPSTLMVEEGFEYADYVVIDTNNTNNGEYTGIIYGIDTLDQNPDMTALATLDDALTTNNGDEYLVIEANENGVESTGATITVVDENGEALETYVFVYFGDVNGDGMLTGDDAWAISEYEVTYTEIYSYASYVAGDVTGDGMPTGDDAWAISEYEVTYSEVDFQYNMGQNAMNNMYEWIY